MARVLFALFLAGAMLLEPDVAASQTYPARQVHMIVTFPPGGNADTIARLVADKLTQNLRQPVIVENKPGAASIVGTAAVAQAPADGHTLLQAGTNISTNPALGHKTSYDAERDLEPVALLVTVPAVVVVHPSLPVNTLAELCHPRQIAARRSELRLRRKRLVSPSRRREARPGDRHQDDARPVPRFRARADRPVAQ
jgi:tripartite-type tricarboxylate transporter receptor subunit TctC